MRRRRNYEVRCGNGLRQTKMNAGTGKGNELQQRKRNERRNRCIIGRVETRDV